jgi:hypothetical protein
MSVRHVFRVEGLPDFREPTEITIVVPVRAGPSFPVEMDFPTEILSDPNQLVGSPVMTSGSQQPTYVTTATQQPQTAMVASSPWPSASGSPQPVFASSMSQPTSLITTQSSSTVNMGAGQNPFGSLSMPVQSVSAQRPLSPGRPTLSAGTIQQPFLPSVTNPTAPQEAQPVLLSRSSLTTGPLQALSPRGQTVSSSFATASSFPGTPQQGTLSAAPIWTAPSQTPVLQTGRTSVTQIPVVSVPPAQVLTQRLTGGELADRFAALPPTISTVGTQQWQSQPSQSGQVSSPKPPPSAPQLSKRSSVSSLSSLLTSPKILTPGRFQSASASSSNGNGGDAQMAEEGNGQGEGDNESGIMLPSMSIYRCSPAQDLGEPVCQQVFPRFVAGGQTI